MPDKAPISVSDSSGSPNTDNLQSSSKVSHGQGSNNAASNGYWIHDDFGPKHYVAPPDANALNVDEGALVARIDLALQACVDLDSSRMQVALEDGMVLLNGTASSATDSQIAGRAVQSAAGDVQVFNRLVVDESLKNNGIIP